MGNRPGRHRLVETVKKTNWWQRASVGVAAGTAILAGFAFTSGGANAAYLGGVNYDSIGEAGYGAYSGAGTQMRLLEGTIDLNTADEGLAAGVQYGTGLQLCDSNLADATVGDTVQIGYIYNGNGTFTFLADAGQLAINSGTNSPCRGSGSLEQYEATTTAIHAVGVPGANVHRDYGSVKLLTNVPVGHDVQFGVSFNHSGHLFGRNIHFVATDVTSNTGAQSFTLYDGSSFSSAFGTYYPQFFELGAGTVDSTANLSAPAVNDIADFTGLNGQSYATGVLPMFWWTAFKVESTPSGDGTTTPLITPSTVAGNAKVTSFNILAGTRTGV